MRRLLTLVLVLLAVPPLYARTSATLVDARLDVDALRVGVPATAIVTIRIGDGLHAQSHTPLGESYIPLTLSLSPLPGIVAAEPQYPLGETVTYPQLGKLNVYIGQVAIRVPLTIQEDVANGPLTINGKVRLQACNDKSCFPPENISFTIDTTAVGSRAKAATASAANAPTTIEATAAPGSPTKHSGGLTVFGVDLTRGGLPLILAAAFLVGIVFNAMPCVLPVVPLKIMGFYEVSQHDRGKSLRLGTVFSAGLVLFFLILATLIVGLHVIAWGDLFKKTWFTVTIVGVLTAMALGTFGFFSVAVPARLYAVSPKHDTYTGNFLFGMLTAALSTPCTFGAFVALLAWTLTQPTWVGFALFTAVGVGMAFPYFVLSAVPEVARKFPRTGPWAEVVKQMMAFLLLATAVFFAQPLISRYLSTTAVWWTLFAVIAAGGLFLISRAFQLSPHFRARLIATAIAVLLVLPSFALVRRLTSRPYEWQAFSQRALDDARVAGRPVVIDFTADWCGNCHWLEATVLHDPKIVSAVRDRNALMLQADVTHDNAPGQPLLTELNPTGSIPFTAVYASPTEKPSTLDGIYNVDDLLKLLH